MRSSYDWVLFDADETLFHFDSFSGLRLMFSNFNVDFAKEDYQNYQAINKPLWVDYQSGTITARQLQHHRFDAWANRLEVSTEVLNKAFLEAMAVVCKPFDGALDLLKALKGRAKLGIITNGFIDLQQSRLEHNGLKEYFDIVVISEQVGVAKPHPEIFEHAYLCMGCPDRKRVLMVGDNPASDIIGGINAGFDTCWFNNGTATLPNGVIPNYQVASLSEIQAIFIGAKVA